MQWQQCYNYNFFKKKKPKKGNWVKSETGNSDCAIKKKKTLKFNSS